MWRIVCWLARLYGGWVTVFSGGVEDICDDLTLIFAFGGAVVSWVVGLWFLPLMHNPQSERDI